MKRRLFVVAIAALGLAGWWLWRAPAPGVWTSAAAAGGAPVSAATSGAQEARSRVRSAVGREAVPQTALRHPSSKAAPSGTGFTGRVLDRRGAPVAGARLWATEWRRLDAPLPEGAVVWRRTGSEALVAHRTRTDEAGRYRFDRLSPSPSGSESWIVAWADAGVAGITAVRPSLEGMVRRAPDLVLLPGAVLRGRVRTRGGRDVPNVKVACFGPPELTEGTTDGAGRFRIGPLPAGQWKPVVSSPDWVQIGDPSVELGWNDEGGVTLEVVPARPVVVRVLDEAGAPLGDVRVSMDAEVDWSETAFSEASTGEARFRAVPRVPVFLGASGDGWRQRSPLRRLTPEETHVVVHMRPYREGRVASGRVVDARTGGPVAGAVVGVVTVGHDGHVSCLQDFRPHSWCATTANEEGNFSLPLLSFQHRARLRVLAPGYADHVTPELPRGSEGPPPVLVALQPATAVELRVVDADGHPVPAARVKAESRHVSTEGFDADLARFVEGEHPPRWVYPPVLTDEEGVARLPWLRPGRYTVTVQARDHLPRTLDVTLVAGPPLRETVRLPRGGALRVEVVDRTGAPVPGVRVVACSRSGGACREAVTDPAGTCVLEPLPQGRCGVMAGLLSIGALSSALERIERSKPEGEGWPYIVRAGEETRIRLVYEPRVYGHLSGRVMAPHEDLLTLRGHLFSVEEAPGFPRGLAESHSFAVDAAGRFEVGSLVPGRYGLIMFKSNGGIDYPEREISVAPGGVTTIEIDLRTGVLEGRLTNGEGHPLSDALVRILVPGSPSDDEGAWHEAFSGDTDEEGRFEFRALAGPVRVEALAPGYTLGRVDVDLPAGGHRTLPDIRLHEGGWIRLVVEYPKRLGMMSVFALAHTVSHGREESFGGSEAGVGRVAFFVGRPADPDAPATWEVSVGLRAPGTGEVLAEKSLTVPDAPQDRNREVHVRFEEE